MKLTIKDGVRTLVTSPGDADTLFIRAARLLRYRPKGYRFNRAYKGGHWDGYSTLVTKDGSDVYIPTGLVPYLLEQLGESARLLLVEDKRDQWPAVVGCFGAPRTVELDPVQEDAVAKAIMAGTGIVNYPTGVGKGRIMGQIVARLNTPTLVLVDRKDLLTQIAKEIEPSIGQDCGQIGDGVWNPKDCTIATVQTLDRTINRPMLLQVAIARAKREGKSTAKYEAELPMARHAATEMVQHLAGYHMVIVDEAHHAESEQYQRVLGVMPGTMYRFGMSATPFRSFAGKTEGMETYLKVQAVLGPPIASLSISDALNTGRIVRPDIFMVELDKKWVHPPVMNYKQEYQYLLMENAQRNALITALATRLNGSTVVLAERTEHGENLAALIGCPFIHGGTDSATRNKHYTYFRSGREKVLVISKLANEGLDLPNMQTLILAGGGKAAHVKTQQIGRAMRASAGKDSATVFDFIDHGKYLSAHSKQRLRAYHREEAYNVVDITEADLWDIIRRGMEASV